MNEKYFVTKCRKKKYIRNKSVKFNFHEKVIFVYNKEKYNIQKE